MMRLAIVSLVFATVACGTSSDSEPTANAEGAVSSYGWTGPEVAALEQRLLGVWDGDDGRVLALFNGRRYQLERPCAPDAGACPAPETGTWAGVRDAASGRSAIMFGKTFDPEDTLGTIDKLNSPTGGMSWYRALPNGEATTSLVGSQSLPVGGTRGTFVRHVGADASVRD